MSSKLYINVILVGSTYWGRILQTIKLKKHIGGVGYKESLKAQFFHIRPPEKEKRNNPYQVIYFTGDILAPDYWAKCQHLKTDDGKQPFVINHLNNGQPLYGGFNACSTRIRITPDIGAQVLFQCRAIGDRILAEFIEGIRSKLQKYVVNQGD